MAVPPEASARLVKVADVTKPPVKARQTCQDCVDAEASGQNRREADMQRGVRITYHLAGRAVTEAKAPRAAVRLKT